MTSRSLNTLRENPIPLPVQGEGEGEGSIHAVAYLPSFPHWKSRLSLRAAAAESSAEIR